MFHHVLIPLDGTSSAESVIPFARALLEATRAKVTLVHVIEKASPGHAHGEIHLTDRDTAAGYLRSVADSHFKGFDGCEIHVHDYDVPGIAAGLATHAFELEPDLILMASHGEHYLRDVVNGNLAHRVAGIGKVPVLLYRGGAVLEPTSRILVAVGGNPEHEVSIPFAANLSLVLGSELLFLTVVNAASDEASAKTRLEVLAAQFPEVNSRSSVAFGDPVDSVLRFCRNERVGIVVLATHGKSGIEAFWSGSLAAKLLPHLNVPCLIVPV
ncbi:MAG: universal stress protein [Planctomycetota bacterium]